MQCEEYDRLRAQVKIAREDYVQAVSTVDPRVTKMESRRTVERSQGAVTNAEQLVADHLRKCDRCQNKSV